MALKKVLGGPGFVQTPSSFNAAAPGPIGGITPSTGAFTNVTTPLINGQKPITLGEIIAIQTVFYQP